jgi:uncharacterized protein YndB with AHSA1/START domain
LRGPVRRQRRTAWRRCHSALDQPIDALLIRTAALVAFDPKHYELADEVAENEGTFKMSFRNFTTGKSHVFGGEYVELVPGERLRYTDKFDDPNLPGEIQVTVALKKVSVGTELDIVQAGLPDVIPPEACYLGWQESLRNLAKRVEPEINQ